MQKVKLTRAAFVLAATVALGGCSDEKKSDKPASQQPAPTAQKPEPAKPSKPPTDTTPDAEPEPVGRIVMKGSKHHDTAPADSATTSSDPAQQAKIDELNRKAAASQGKNESGDPIKAPDIAAPTAPKRTRAVVVAEINSIDARLKALEVEQASLVDNQRNRHGSTPVPKDDQAAARLAEINQATNDLKAQRVSDQQEIANLDAASPPR